jgi:hypothetical protein
MHRRKAVESTQALEETKAELDRLKQQADKVCGARHLDVSRPSNRFLNQFGYFSIEWAQIFGHFVLMWVLKEPKYDLNQFESAVRLLLATIGMARLAHSEKAKARIQGLLVGSVSCGNSATRAARVFAASFLYVFRYRAYYLLVKPDGVVMRLSNCRGTAEMSDRSADHHAWVTQRVLICGRFMFQVNKMLSEKNEQIEAEASQRRRLQVR